MSDFDVSEFLDTELAGDEPAPEVVAADPETPRSEKPRDDLGRFTTSEPEAQEDPEPGDEPDTEGEAAEGEPGETAAEAEERLLAGKYRSPDDLERAYQELQQLSSRQGQELGQYRQWYDAQQQQMQQPRYDLSDAENRILENPADAPTIAATALQQQDFYTYDKAIRAWHEVDSVGASRFETQVALYQQQQAMQPQLQQVEALQATQRLQTELDKLVSDHPDAVQVLGALNVETDGIPGLIQVGLQSHDPALRHEAWEALYQHAAQKHGSTVAAAAQQAAAQHQQQAKAAKQAASVASAASSAPATEGTGDPFVDQFFEDILKPSPFNWRAP